MNVNCRLEMSMCIAHRHLHVTWWNSFRRVQGEDSPGNTYVNCTHDIEERMHMHGVLYYSFLETSSQGKYDDELFAKQYLGNFEFCRDDLDLRRRAKLCRSTRPNRDERRRAGQPAWRLSTKEITWSWRNCNCNRLDVRIHAAHLLLVLLIVRRSIVVFG